MKLKPPSAAALPSSSVENPFKSGALVMYENDGQPFIGVILGFRKDRYQVQNMRGKDAELPPFRLHPLPGTLPGQANVTIRTRVDYLLALFERAQKSATGLALRPLWESLPEGDTPIPGETLIAQLAPNATTEQYLCARLALLGDRVYFKRDEKGFIPRPKAVIEELQQREIELQRRQRSLVVTLEEFHQRLVAVKARAPLQPFSAECDHFLRLLEDTAAGTTEQQQERQREAKDFINVLAERENLMLSGSREKRALDILLQVGHFTADTNLAVVRHRPPMQFTAESVTESESFAAAQHLQKIFAVDGAKRVDLTHLKPITIDDRTTRDMDDALSLEQTQDGYELGIHISDVAALIPDGSTVDTEARRRATSLYLAGRPTNMFPEPLAEFGCSLVAGELRPAVSCIFNVSHDFTIQSSKVVLSTIRVAKKLSYVEADQLLESGDRLLNDLYQISSSLEMIRMDAGAFRASKKDAIISPSESGELTLQEIDEEDPSRAMIAEFMVFANSVFAQFAATHALPVVFRGQGLPYEETGEAAAPQGPASDFERRSRMRKSSIGFDPIPHSGLGLQAYIQMTSPIRRYVDLCNQRQVLSFLRCGKPHFTREQFEQVVAEVEPALSRASQVSKETKRFWGLRYLQQMSARKEPIRGTVVRLDGRTPLVELDTVHMTVFARVKNATRLGDRIVLGVNSLDPHLEVVRLEEL